MGKINMDPQPLLLPLPAVLASCAHEDKRSIITLAWAGIISSMPPRIGLGIRPQRFSYNLIAASGEFAVSLPDENLMEAVHVCGSKSGREIDKFKELGLTPVRGKEITSPIIGEAPVTLECKLDRIVEMEGSHHLFIGEIKNVLVEENILNEEGRVDPKKAGIITFGGGNYWRWGSFLESRQP